jgi:DNA-binding response OmpR family regulator
MDGMSPRVLLITDESTAAQSWVEDLRRRGVETSVAGSTGDAQKPWSQDGFDLAIVDADARPDGLGLCQRLRAWTANPILLLIPRFDEAYLLAAYRAGADECVLKPIAPAVLLTRVNAWLRHR